MMIMHHNFLQKLPFLSNSLTEPEPFGSFAFCYTVHVVALLAGLRYVQSEVGPQISPEIAPYTMLSMST